MLETIRRKLEIYTGQKYCHKVSKLSIKLLGGFNPTFGRGNLFDLANVPALSGSQLTNESRSEFWT